MITKIKTKPKTKTAEKIASELETEAKRMLMIAKLLRKGPRS